MGKRKHKRRKLAPSANMSHDLNPIVGQLSQVATPILHRWLELTRTPNPYRLQGSAIAEQAQRARLAYRMAALFDVPIEMLGEFDDPKPDPASPGPPGRLDQPESEAPW